MQDFGGSNIHIINETDVGDITRYLKAVGIIGVRPRPVHANNGTYKHPARVMLPSALSGFQYVAEKHNADKSHVLLLAVNSDISMKNDGQENFEPQDVRAKKIAGPLALQFPNNDVVVVFYDEKTPSEIYASLRKAGMNMCSLHKHGYGTSDADKPIEGAQQFSFVHAFPLLNNVLPAMKSTARQDRTDADTPQSRIDVAKLWEAHGKHGAPYMTGEGVPLFKLASGLQYLGVREGRHSAPDVGL